MCGKWDKVQIKYNKNEDKKIFLQKTEKIEELRITIEDSVAQYFAKENKNEAEILKLESIPEHDFDSSIIEELPEEMEVTTRFTGTIGKGQTGFKSTMKMTGLMKTGGLMNTIKSSMKQNTQQKSAQD